MQVKTYFKEYKINNFSKINTKENRKIFQQLPQSNLPKEKKNYFKKT